MDRSEPVPKFALILSWNVNVPADESNNTVLLPAPILATKVTSSAKFAAPSTSTTSRFAVPSTSMSVLKSILPLIVNTFELVLKERLPSLVTSLLAPARKILPWVESAIT